MAATSMIAISKTHTCDLRTDLDLTRDELESLFELTLQLKRDPSYYAQALKGRYLSLLFEKPSLRTRFTFELAIKQLGGDAVASAGPIGDREPLKDVARNLDRWTSGIVARVYHQQTIDELAHWSSVPVINALSDMFHPCQAIADLFTLKERFGSLNGLKLAYVGDGNNVAHSLMMCATRLGMDFSIATPPGYEPCAEIAAQAAKFAAACGSKFSMTQHPREAVRDANAVYTDVWASMGQESEVEPRRRVFQSYQVNEELMAAAGRSALFMHCLPAKRGEETTDGVAECATSVIFDQAENRLHCQKALLLMMLD